MNGVIIKKAAGLILVVVPVALLFQGLDFTDTGWVLSNYQNVFSAPESVSFWFHMWLANVIGGLWYLAFGWAGLLAMKLGAVVVFWITCFLVFRAFKGLLAGHLIMLGLVLGMAFNFIDKITVIHYNNLSLLFFTAQAFCLLEGLEKDGKAMFFLAGAFSALNGLVRLPNVLSISFLAVVVYRAWMEGGLRSKHPPALAWFFAGFAATAVAAILVMHRLGHLQIYLQSLRSLFSGSTDDLSGYGSAALIKRFIRDHFRAFLAGGGGLAILTGAAALTARLPLRARRWLLAGMAAVVAAAATALYSRIPSAWLIYLPAGVIYLAALNLVLAGKENPRAGSTALLGALILMCLSIGSDTGIKVASYGFVWGLPLVMLAAIDGTLPKLPWLREKGGIGLLRPVIQMFLLVYAVYSAVNLWFDTYRDSPNRLAMTSSVDHPKLRGILTTPERARVVGDMLQALETRVRPGDELLTFESVPMTQFLVKTRPYAGTAWPLLYLPSELSARLEAACTAGETAPLVVMARRETRSPFWPASGGVSSKRVAKECRAVLQDFLARRGYETIWENEMFLIATPGH